MWPFRKKAREAPLDINKNAYLSVLLGPGPRPPVLTWVNPAGSNGAVKGFAAPLDQGESADLLSQPIVNGSYALATPDRKTLVQADFFDLSDVSEFKLPADPASQAMVDLVGDKLQSAVAAVGLATLVFKGYSPDVYQSVRFMLDSAARLAAETSGVVADPLAETYRLPQDLRQENPLDPRIDFRDIGTIKAIRQADGVWIGTRGMAKFNLPEFEVYGVEVSDVTRFGEMLIVSGQEALLGSSMPLGETVSTPFGMVVGITGTRNRELWGERSTIELRLS